MNQSVTPRCFQQTMLTRANQPLFQCKKNQFPAQRECHKQTQHILHAHIHNHSYIHAHMHGHVLCALVNQGKVEAQTHAFIIAGTRQNAQTHSPSPHILSAYILPYAQKSAWTQSLEVRTLSSWGGRNTQKLPAYRALGVLCACYKRHHRTYRERHRAHTLCVVCSNAAMPSRRKAPSNPHTTPNRPLCARFVSVCLLLYPISTTQPHTNRIRSNGRNTAHSLAFLRTDESS